MAWLEDPVDVTVMQQSRLEDIGHEDSETRIHGRRGRSRIAEDLKAA